MRCDEADRRADRTAFVSGREVDMGRAGGASIDPRQQEGGKPGGRRGSRRRAMRNSNEVGGGVGLSGVGMVWG